MLWGDCGTRTRITAFTAQGSTLELKSRQRTHYQLRLRGLCFLSGMGEPKSPKASVVSMSASARPAELIYVLYSFFASCQAFCW